MGLCKNGLGQHHHRAIDHFSVELHHTAVGGFVCRHHGLSVSHFTRAFKCTMGVPPRVYVLQRRVKAACAAMLETDEALTRIAHAHGFCDQSHFTRAFQAQMGTGPQSWRRAASR